MKTNSPIVLFLLLVSLSFAACRRYEEIPNTPNRIWPLKVGNWWEYHEVIRKYEDSTLLYEIVDSVKLAVTMEGYVNAPDPAGEKEVVHLQTYEVTVTRNDLEARIYLHSDETGIYQYARRVFYLDYDDEIDGYTGECKLSGINSTNRQVSIPYPDNGSAAGGAAVSFVFGGCNADSLFEDAIITLSRTPRALQAQGNQTLTVPAGTFEVIDYGLEQWSLDLGMVREEKWNQWQHDSVTWDYQLVRELVRWHLE